MDPITLSIIAITGGVMNVLDSYAEHERMQGIYEQRRELLRKQRQIIAEKLMEDKIQAAKELRNSVASANMQSEQIAREGAVAIGEAKASLGADASIASTADAAVSLYEQQVTREVYEKLGVIETGLDIQQGQIASQVADIENGLMIHEQQQAYEESQMDTSYDFNEGLADFVTGAAASAQLADALSSRFIKSPKEKYVAPKADTGDMTGSSALDSKKLSPTKPILDTIVDTYFGGGLKQYTPEYKPKYLEFNQWG